METTLDLPEELVREMEARAVREGRDLRDVAEEVFRRGLQTQPPASDVRHRVKLPLIPMPPGGKPFDLSGDQLLQLEAQASAGIPDA